MELRKAPTVIAVQITLSEEEAHHLLNVLDHARLFSTGRSDVTTEDKVFRNTLEHNLHALIMS